MLNLVSTSWSLLRKIKIIYRVCEFKMMKDHYIYRNMAVIENTGIIVFNLVFKQQCTTLPLLLVGNNHCASVHAVGLKLINWITRLHNVFLGKIPEISEIRVDCSLGCVAPNASLIY